MVDFSDITTKLKWTSFASSQMGRGFVAFELTEPERARGNYNPHTMFVHDAAESDDAETAKTVEQDCKELAKLLGKFRVANEFFADPVTERAPQ